MTIRRTLVTIFCAAYALPSIAAPLIQGDFIGQPQITVVDGKTIGCGVRVLGLSKASSPSDVVSGFDVAFMLYQDGRTLLKGLAFKPFVVKNRGLGGLKDSYVPLKSFWLKAPNKNAATAINQKFVKGETKNSLLYTADFELTAGLLATIMEGKELLVATYIVGAPVEQVYHGVVTLSDAEMAQIAQCTKELSPQ